MTRKMAGGISAVILALLSIATVLHYTAPEEKVAPGPELVSDELDKSSSFLEDVVPRKSQLANSGTSTEPRVTIRNRRPNPNSPKLADGSVAAPSEFGVSAQNAREAREMSDPGPRNLEPEVVREAIDDIKPLIKDCYEKSLLMNPSLTGKITLEFELEAEDSVIRTVQAQVDNEGTTLNDEQVTECALKALGELELKGITSLDGIMKVRFPFVFLAD